jgi:SulP family sulfate permease
MAIAVASGVSPAQGLYTAIVGGFVVSLLSGSRFQIGGPAGAFIVLVAATAAKFGPEGLMLTVLMSGAMLTLVGVLRLGSLIRHIPHAVTVGFTCGIAVTIAASQVKDFGGLRLTGAEPGPLIPKLTALVEALPTINPAALGLGAAVAALIFLAQALSAELARHADRGDGGFAAPRSCSALPVETIGSRFGGLPRGLPSPHLPPLSVALAMQLLPAALSFTLLGGVESLLSAKVADGMTGRKHRSNMELIAQGLANIASACFGGIA